MPYTYILYSKSIDKFYIGFTAGELEERLRKHNSNHKGFTGKASDWEMIWTQAFDTETGARARERQIKAWKSRKMILKLVGSEHPDL